MFGSLAQRSAHNRAGLDRLIAALPAAAQRVFDVNLRAPPDDLALVPALAVNASLIKLPAVEAARLGEWVARQRGATPADAAATPR